jgi:hypothetical protein
VAQIGPFQASKNIRFTIGDGMEEAQGGAVNLRAEPEGAEVSTARFWGVCAAQNCTSGIGSRSRLQLKTLP